MKIAQSLYTSSLLLLLISLISCDSYETTSFNPSSEPSNYEISSSNAGMYSWYKEGSCHSDKHDNILLRNDSLYVEGKLNDEWGQFARKLQANEIEQLEEYVHAYSNEPRDKKINSEECGGLTSLYIKKEGVVLDSLMDAGLKWREKDRELFIFIARLVCDGDFINLGGKEIFYPSERMVIPPQRVTVPFYKE